MVAAALVERDIEDGKTLVRRLDQDSFRVTAALWFYDSDFERWKLIIESDLVGKHGPLEAYRRLSDSVRKIKTGGFALDPVRVELVKETNELTRLLRRAVSTGPGISGIRLSNNSINGTFIEDAYIYRAV